MANVVFDASTLVGALLKANSIPERALLLARSHETICLSPAVEAEIRAVFRRPKFRKYLSSGRGERILDLIATAALSVSPSQIVTDCRDPTDNKYLELALAAGATAIVASDDDLLVLDPWRGIQIITPAEYVRRFEVLPGETK
jgi:putative PIN family toxin of toxin-antitoxin system